MIGRAARRQARKQHVAAMFPDATEVALDLLELLELAWHDCYGEVSPSEEVIADILLLADGSIEKLIGAAKVAVEDSRDLRVWADQDRTKRT